MKPFLILLCLLPSVWGAVRTAETEENVVIENGYTKVIFDKLLGQISSLSADFHGDGNYGPSILAFPFALEIKGPANETCLRNSVGSKRSPLLASWKSQTDKLVTVQFSGISDCASDPLVEETWTLSLAENQRNVDINISGHTLRSGSVFGVMHSLYLNSLSVYGLFDRGLAQMMNKQGSCMGSNQTLDRVYFVGNSSALDFSRTDSSADEREIVLLSAGTGYSSGIQDIVVGKYPNLSLRMSEAWTPCWRQIGGATAVTGKEVWDVSYVIAPNNYDFPVHALSRLSADHINLPFTDLRTYLTGIYASPVGCLQSYYDKQTGTIAPTVAHPDVGYSPDTNFFDPDNFISLSAMMYSGDDYLIRQVKEVLDRTVETMCGIGSNQVKSYCDAGRQRLTHKPMFISRFHDPNKASTSRSTSPKKSLRLPSPSPNQPSSVSADTSTSSRAGQLMHHFVSLNPTYESIAGSEQLGPNVFWTMSALRYISISQDTAWARHIFPYIDLSTRFLLTFIDESRDLVLAPGPLWIDVIVRENYTSDSAAIIVPLFRQIADFYDFMGEDAEFSSLLRQISSRVADGMNAQLWAPTAADGSGGDHYVTQVNPDGTSRDFVDYDSNLLTVAFGIAPPDRISKLLTRVDSGEFTHIRATWCSEKPYTGDACDCYIVGGTVCGDSVVTLARIGWVDSLARKKVKDLRTFEDLLLVPLQKDLIKDVWLYERYDGSGNQIRTPFYFEYPALVTMMLREVRYGVDVSLLSVVIDPFPAAPFTLAVGAVNVQYSAEAVVVQLPGDSSSATPKSVSVSGLTPNAEYSVSGNQIISANSEGWLTVPAWTFSTDSTLSITRH